MRNSNKIEFYKEKTDIISTNKNVRKRMQEILSFGDVHFDHTHARAHTLHFWTPNNNFFEFLKSFL